MTGMFDDLDTLEPNGVRRDAKGRPYIRSACPDDRLGAGPCDAGRVPGARAGTTKNCPSCKGKGFVEKVYTRCTSFVGVLESTDQLTAWKVRTTLAGLAVDSEPGEPGLAGRLSTIDPDAPEARHQLEEIAAEAFRLGDGHAKRQRGTDLHYLSEFVDRGDPLPETLSQEDAPRREVTLQDRADLAAWQRVKDDLGLVILESELFVVNDQYRIAGTLDRLADFKEDGPDLLVGEEHPCEICGKPVIIDIKTGRIDYGAGKMCQQLAVYANSDRYNMETGERTPLDACRHVGLIVRLVQGTGLATVHRADLVKGWEAVELSSRVRQHRNESRKWLEELPQDYLTPAGDPVE